MVSPCPSMCSTLKDEERDEKGGRVSCHGNPTPLMRQSNWSTSVLAFVQSSDDINKEVVCIIRAYWLPKETEEEEHVLFGRL